MNEETQQVILKGLKPCPFCGGAPEFHEISRAHGAGASGMEAPDLALRCSNTNCPIQPQTKPVKTEAWEQGVGYYKVDMTDKLIKAWESRTALQAEDG